ncbi:MAG TPA: NAD(P)H-hydrate dehydratase, partial [Luteolibacter sp.]|nr:NAD(P)H-hydrate dehydratase [Luteolibacter sp.]
VTLHVPPDAAELISAKCPPDVIIRPCADPLELLDQRFDSLVIGCGLHHDDPDFKNAVLELVSRTEIPTVLDAEALNLIPYTRLSLLRKNHILTPHPGEFRRLAPDLSEIPREESARIFASRVPSTLLLKGCRTIVTSPDGTLRFNPTGTPAMATGGQGDLLSGVIGALLAIGNPLAEAASIAAWICGRAAEIALLDPRISEQSLLPSDVARHLGAAFKDWAARRR